MLLVEGDNTLNVQQVPIALPFDPWSYDFNGNGVIDTSEMLAAANDYFAGIITKDQVEQVRALWEQAPPPPSTTIQVVDLDANNNGIVDAEDESAFLTVYPSVEGDPKYDRQFDANFDGVIDNKDYAIFSQTMGKNLNAIRDNIKTGIYEYLVWPDGWDASLTALNKDMVQEFTGRGVGKTGWISIQLHPYILPDYYCQVFSVDTAVAAYKGLGYGCLLFAGSGEHSYNTFWVGGDWRDLNNWYILEPQNGAIYSAVANLPSTYQTKKIYFLDYSAPYPYGEHKLRIYGHTLIIDHELGRLDFASGSYGYPAYRVEEPMPDVFDRAYLVGV